MITKDNSEYGIAVSDVFLEVLDQDDIAKVLFEKLTLGKKRTLIFWVDSVKSTDIRIRRAIVLMEHLKQVEGKVDFKLLNAQMKRANEAAKGK